MAVTASGDAERIKWLAEVGKFPGDLLEEDEIKEIDRIGRGFHYRGYVSDKLCCLCVLLVDGYGIVSLNI